MYDQCQVKLPVAISSVVRARGSDQNPKLGQTLRLPPHWNPLSHQHLVCCGSATQPHSITPLPMFLEANFWMEIWTEHRCKVWSAPQARHQTLSTSAGRLARPDEAETSPELLCGLTCSTMFLILIVGKNEHWLGFVFYIMMGRMKVFYDRKKFKFLKCLVLISFHLNYQGCGFCILQNPTWNLMHFCRTQQDLPVMKAAVVPSTN